MNNIEYISISTVLANWKQIAVNELNINDSLIIEWMLDAYYDIGTYKQYCERVIFLKARDFKVQLPPGVKQSLFVLANPTPSEVAPTILTELTKQDLNDPNCTWTFKRTCKCDKECSCSGNYIETDSWLYLENIEKAKSFNFASVRDFTNWTSNKGNQWIILEPKRNELSLLRHVNKDFEQSLKPNETFALKNGYLVVDFKDADLIFGFLSLPLDEDGLPLVPNNSNFVNALIAAAEKKLAYIQYRKSRNNADAAFLGTAEKEYIKFKLKAREDMNSQTYNEMIAMGESLNQFIMPNKYKGLDRRVKQNINNGFTRY